MSDAVGTATTTSAHLHLSHKPLAIHSALPTPDLTPLPSPPAVDLAQVTPPPPPSRPHQHLTTLRKFLLVTDGRDKALKLVQYVVKFLLWSYIDSRKKVHPDLHQHLRALASNFSTTRKIIRLGHVVEPYGDLIDLASSKSLPSTASHHERLIHALALIYCAIAFAQDISDDVFCLAKIGVLPKHLAKRAEPISIKLWFATIWLDVHKNLFDTFVLREKMHRLRRAKDRELKRKAREGDEKKDYDVVEFDFELEKREEEEEEAMRDKMFWLKLSLVKLLMDGAFCGYDYFECNFSDGFQAVTGLASGLLSSYKLWYKCSHN